jgi:DnaJ-class molecular chaperone
MTHFKPCPECEGQGTVTYERVHSHNVGRDVGFIEEYEDACENCDGTGQIEDDEYEEVYLEDQPRDHLQQLIEEGDPNEPTEDEYEEMYRG